MVLWRGVLHCLKQTFKVIVFKISQLDVCRSQSYGKCISVATGATVPHKGMFLLLSLLKKKPKQHFLCTLYLNIFK